VSRVNAKRTQPGLIKAKEMNRSNFLQAQSYNNDAISICGEDNCECDNSTGNELAEKIKAFHLITVAILAFLCASAFTSISSYVKNRNSIDWLNNENLFAISCGAGTTMNYHEPFTSKKQTGKDSRNACPHQSATACFSCINDNRRKKNYRSL
jgi:hypothetical protein